MKKTASQYKKSKTLVYIIIACIIIAGLAALCYFTFFQKPEADRSPQTVENNYVKDPYQGLIENGTNNDQQSSDDKILTPDNTDTSNQSELEKPLITRAEQIDNFIRISATISTASSGMCTVSLKNGTTEIKRSAKIIVGPSYYTCNGFRIARSEFQTQGIWTVTVAHELNGKSAQSESKELIIK